MTITLFIAGCLLPMTVMVTGQQEYRAECAVWRNVTDSETAVPMHCDTNPQCTGIDCSCEFSYNGLFTAGQSFVEDFCFGVAIHPCKKPLEMHFYVESPNEDPSDTYQRTVRNGTSFQLPGVHYTVSQFVSADGFVDVTMQEQMYQGHRYVKLGLFYKTKISTPISTSWPDELSFPLLPDTLVPVPPCRSSVVTPTHTPGNCTAYTAVRTTRKPGSPTGPPPKPGLNCTVGVANSCNNHERCVASTNTTRLGHCECTTGYERVDGQCVLPNSGPEMPRMECTVSKRTEECGQHMMCMPAFGKKAYCECINGYTWNGKACVTQGTTPSIRIIGDPMILDPKNNEPDHSQDDGGSSKSKIIIPVIVGAVVLIMAVAAIIVVIKYKRYKARYGQHTLLMSEEDDRDDNDAPMVEA